jgi:hypothetical protein
MSRLADLSIYSQRLTPSEVARLWFRRSPTYAPEIHEHHPDFPKAGPDGLYLREAVKEWFDRWHGRRQGSGASAALDAAEAEALRIAQSGRR